MKLGPDHRDTLLSRHNLGWWYFQSGRVAESLEAATEVGLVHERLVLEDLSLHCEEGRLEETPSLDGHRFGNAGAAEQGAHRPPAAGDPTIERVTVVKPVRVGFTTLLTGAIASYVANDPPPILAFAARLRRLRTNC